VASFKDHYRGHASEPDDAYFASVGERTPHATLTLGDVARQGDAIAKAAATLTRLKSMIDDVESRLARLEKAPT
jgi:hypothetical protein